jgi:hypothetical protein
MRLAAPPLPRLLRPLAGLALLAAAACAPQQPPIVYAPPPVDEVVQVAAPGSKTGAVPRDPASIAGPACVPEHRAAIDAALATARQRLAVAVRLVEERPQDPHVRRWFGTAPAGVVAERLRRTAAWMQTPDRAKILCNDPQLCADQRVAFASASRSVIGLCPTFFRARATGYDTPMGILIHEVSHIAAGTQDFAYGPNATLILAKADPQRAAANADNYEYFVETLPN